MSTEALWENKASSTKVSGLTKLVSPSPYDIECESVTVSAAYIVLSRFSSGPAGFSARL